jgi:DNA-binding NarL/FixJ family response regulator
MNGELTARELDVLEDLSTGQLYKEIADKRGVTIDAIKKHCKNIYRKLQVRNRTEAAIKFKEGQVK